MYVNLHTLPAGMHMYTVCIADREERKAFPTDFSYDEFDLPAPSSATAADVIRAAEASSDWGYDGPHLEVIAVIDQSTGEVVWQAA